MVGTLIRAARKARGWTQGALARRAGVSLGDVGNIERGMITRRTLQVARRLAEFLDIERDPPQEQTPRPWRWQGMQDKRSV
jgi:transcriptional regulator with XRE-family HTH domain